MDFLLIGGFSMFYFFAIKYFHTGERAYWVYTGGALLSWVVNWPHFSATSYRLYGSRENIRQYPVTALVVPFVVFGMVVLALALPDQVGPWFVKLFLIWSPYHFSGQTLGLSLLYARRAGITFPPFARFALSAFIYGTYLSQTLRAEVGLNGFPYYTLQVPMFGVPMWLYEFSLNLMYLAAAVTFIYYAYWSVRNRKVFPWIVALPGITQYVWFVQGGSIPAYNEFVPLFHSLQYMMIAWSMQVFESSQKSPQVSAVVESAKWIAGNIFGGSMLFYFLPLAGAWLSGIPISTTTGIFIAGVQIHHFFVDGVIWKLRRSSILSPLMMSWRDLKGPKGAVA